MWIYIQHILGFGVTIQICGFAGTIDMSRKNPTPAQRAGGYFVIYKILAEVDIYSIRPNTPVHVDSLTKKCRGTITSPNTPRDSQVTYKLTTKRSKPSFSYSNIILRKAYNTISNTRVFFFAH